ncbi:KOW domain-containing RNA-binding protein [Cellulosilyticum sp. I15G10I2]|uniref:KOW domain-containing RNA-binding protein n=1 Tax=Cellulosilyticum sp. I15G10I2 TaxID=1892843 RepID=UPI00085CD97C|nr:KOW domain-containing RNA-binding protein [Cellulosilyticum sp. I15G10I2]
MNSEYEVGQVVFSKCGRDQGKPFIVVSVEEEYVYLSDGKLRKVDNPKLKKKKHVQKTNTIIEWIKQKIIEENRLTNNDVRKALKEYIGQSSV